MRMVVMVLLVALAACSDDTDPKQTAGVAGAAGQSVAGTAGMGVNLAIGLVAGSCAVESCPPWQVYVFAGQSNCIGTGVMSDLDIPNPDPRGLIWYKFDDPVNDDSEGWVTLQGRANNTLFAAWRTFADELLKRQPRVALICYAVNGSSLYNRWLPSQGDLYPKLITHINAALGTFTEPYRLAGLGWIQGEKDAAGTYEQADAYATNLAAFMAELRADTGVADLPIYFNRLNIYVGYAQRDVVRARQETFAAADSYAHILFYDSDKIDGVHYTTEGQDELGRELAALVP